jgi:hypothetical protein
MKKTFIALFVLILLLAGCQTGTTPASTTDPVTTTPTTGDTTTTPAATTSTRYVKNSKWQTVKTVEVTTSRAAVTEDDLKKEVITYNLATTDDQQTILTTDVPIAESPYIDVYIVNPTTHAIIESYLHWERADYVARYALFVQQANADGGVLYVDQIPPAPVVADDTRTPYEKYALYLVSSAGAIIGEEHCADASWQDNGWASLDDYFEARKKGYELQARCDGAGEYVVAGKIYTASCR